MSVLQGTGSSLLPGRSKALYSRSPITLRLNLSRGGPRAGGFTQWINFLAGTLKAAGISVCGAVVRGDISIKPTAIIAEIIQLFIFPPP